MGLNAALGNAISGMSIGQSSLEVLSRNVANAGTPGYHRQSLSVSDMNGANSTYVRAGGVERAFNQSLQANYTKSVSDAGFSNIRADVLDRLQLFLGKPGDPGSLDASFSDLQNALQQLGASPDSYAARSSVVSQAQGMAGTLNTLTSQVQGLRQEAEARIASDVAVLNQSLSSLADVNGRLGNQSTDGASRATLMDQRDRLVSQVSELIDVRADYRSDGTVALMTRSGIGILDNKASTFDYQSRGMLSAEKQLDLDPDRSGVGSLILHTPAGLDIDLVQQNVLKSGELAGLIDLRDKTLVATQDQLDSIAAGLAQALSTVTTSGTAASAGGADGFGLDLGSIRDGNDFLLDYTQNGVGKSIRVVRVDDASKLPLDYVDANGTRVLGVNFSGGASAVANTLRAALGPGFAVSNPSGNVLHVLDDGAPGTTAVKALTGRATATGLQRGQLGLGLFVDTASGDFTNSLSGTGQQRGFAGRIAVNAAVVSDSKLLVQYQPGGSLGDAARPDYLIGQLQSMRFAATETGGAQSGSFRIGGTVGDMIAQAMDYQGNVAETALGDQQTQQLTVDTLSARLDSENGVSVDDEMARLMELQNAYSANARVISVVQELLNRLMDL